MTAPTLPRRRTRSGASVQRTAANTIVEPEPLPAAVRDLLDKAAQWPEYADYFRTEAAKAYGRPIPTDN